MRRLHVIDSHDRMGGEVYFRHADKYAHDPELMEAYECGRKQGWREAMEEVEHGGSYHHRDHIGRTMPPMMREHDHGWDDDDEYVKYRRGRDSMGRYIGR